MLFFCTFRCVDLLPYVSQLFRHVRIHFLELLPAVLLGLPSPQGLFVRLRGVVQQLLGEHAVRQSYLRATLTSETAAGRLRSIRIHNLVYLQRIIVQIPEVIIGKGTGFQWVRFSRYTVVICRYNAQIIRLRTEQLRRIRSVHAPAGRRWIRKMLIVSIAERVQGVWGTLGALQGPQLVKEEGDLLLGFPLLRFLLANKVASCFLHRQNQLVILCLKPVSNVS